MRASSSNNYTRAERHIFAAEAIQTSRHLSDTTLNDLRKPLLQTVISQYESLNACCNNMSVSNIKPCSNSRTAKSTVASLERSEACGTMWDPFKIFSCPLDYNHALVILNRPINLPFTLVSNVWKRARVRVTVDGGTDRWTRYLGSRSKTIFSGNNGEFLPDLVTGDMDSVSPEAIEDLRSLGVTVIVTPDQNATDYTKALYQLGIYSQAKHLKLDGIYVFSDTSGRLDHTIANINTLFKANELVGDTQVIQVSSKSLTWLLRPGLHRISIPEALIRDETWCALMPIGCPVKNITTTGLKWNLDNATLEFGGLISTSNTYSGLSEVTITTDTSVVWSMGIGPLVDVADSPNLPQL